MSFDFGFSWSCLPQHLLDGHPVAVFKFLFLVLIAVIVYRTVRRIYKSELFKSTVTLFGILLVYGLLTSSETRTRVSDILFQIWEKGTEQFEDFKD